MSLTKIYFLIAGAPPVIDVLYKHGSATGYGYDTLATLQTFHQISLLLREVAVAMWVIVIMGSIMSIYAIQVFNRPVTFGTGRAA